GALALRPRGPATGVETGRGEAARTRSTGCRFVESGQKLAAPGGRSIRSGKAGRGRREVRRGSACHPEDDHLTRCWGAGGPGGWAGVEWPLRPTAPVTRWREAEP